MLRFVSVDVGEGRALGCARCSMPAAATYRTVAEVRDALADAVRGGPAEPGPNVLVTGPEPFAHPELPELVAACVDAGAERIAVETDGGGLSVEGNARGLLHAGVRHLRIRLLATDEVLADGLTGKPGLARAAMIGVRAYLDAADADGLTIAVTAVVPVCRHNVDALPATVAGLAAWGVQGTSLLAADEMAADATPLVIAACDTGMVNRLWVEADGFALPESHALHAVPEVTAGG